MKSNMIHACVKMGLIEPPMANFLDFLFDSMRVAEEEIAAAINKHPKKHREAINETFKHACVTQPLRLKQSLTLYRSHVRELIERMIAGADVRPGTRAEVLATLSECSYAAPLPNQPYTLFIRLFSEIYPQHMKEIGNPEWKKLESWPGYSDELLHELSRKLRNERGIEPKPKKTKKGANLEVHNKETSRVSSRPQNGHRPRDSGLPRGRGSRPQNGRNERPVRRAQGNRGEPPRRRPLD
jgi:hypothetical protein